MNTTSLHITGDQSLRLLRAARAKDLLTAIPSDCREIEPLPSTIRSLADINAPDLLNWLNVSKENPLTVLVPHSDKRRHLPGIKTIVIATQLPANSFLELKEVPGGFRLPNDIRILIDAPPLALAYAANSLDRQAGHKLISLGNSGQRSSLEQVLSAQTIQEINDLNAQNDSSLDALERKLRLIALACEFCGLYARDPLKPHISEAHYDRPGSCGRFTTPTELLRSLKAMDHVRGVAAARSAAQYAIDESGSPMETCLNLSLTLPPRLAGFSMQQPLANKELVITGTRSALLKHDYIHPDLQWPSIKLLIEFLGNKDHASKRARIEDKNRLKDYTLEDYKTLFLMYDDICNVAALNNTVELIAREFAKHGKKFEPYRVRRLMRDEGFHARQLRFLATLLPPVARYE